MKRNVWLAGLAAIALASGFAIAHGGNWGPNAAGPGCGALYGTGGGPRAMHGPMGYGPMGLGEWGPGRAVEPALSAEQREKIAAVRGELARQMEKTRTEARERIDAILTAEQRASRDRPYGPR
jgi:hypothetical protein